MVYFVLTRSGYDELAKSLDLTKVVLWIREGVLSAAEFSKLGGACLELSAIRTDLDDLSLRSALETIQEHHPEKTIWVEAQ